MTSRWEVATLLKRHERRAFDCGDFQLNDFLKLHARQNQTADVGRTWVATSPGDRAVVGYYTLAAGAVGRQLLVQGDAAHLPRYPVPVAHLGRLAVDLKSRGEGLGEHLLVHALEQVARVSTTIGLYAVEVRAKNAAARDFYRHYGFVSMLDDPNHLYLSMRAVRRLFEAD